MKENIIIGLATGTVSSICVTLIINYITKKINERKLLDEAVQIYIKYGFEVIKCLRRYNEDNNSKEARRVVEDVIDNYPQHIGFHYTNSNILQEFINVINDIEYDIISEQLNTNKILEYCKKIQRIRSDMSKIKYNIFYKLHK